MSTNDITLNDVLKNELSSRRRQSQVSDRVTTTDISTRLAEAEDEELVCRLAMRKSLLRKDEVRYEEDLVKWVASQAELKEVTEAHKSYVKPARSSGLYLRVITEDNSDKKSPPRETSLPTELSGYCISNSPVLTIQEKEEARKEGFLAHEAVFQRALDDLQLMRDMGLIEETRPARRSRRTRRSSTASDEFSAGIEPAFSTLSDDSDESIEPARDCDEKSSSAGSLLVFKSSATTMAPTQEAEGTASIISNVSSPSGELSDQNNSALKARIQVQTPLTAADIAEAEKARARGHATRARLMTEHQVDAREALKSSVALPFQNNSNGLPCNSVLVRHRIRNIANYFSLPNDSTPSSVLAFILRNVSISRSFFAPLNGGHCFSRVSGPIANTRMSETGTAVHMKILYTFIKLDWEEAFQGFLSEVHCNENDEANNNDLTVSGPPLIRSATIHRS